MYAELLKLHNSRITAHTYIYQNSENTASNWLNFLFDLFMYVHSISINTLYHWLTDWVRKFKKKKNSYRLPYIPLFPPFYAIVFSISSLLIHRHNMDNKNIFWDSLVVMFYRTLFSSFYIQKKILFKKNCDLL